MNEEKSSGNTHVTISGDVGGSVAIGQHIVQGGVSGSVASGEHIRQTQAPADAVGSNDLPQDAGGRAYLIHLRETLATRFDEGELRTLCFDLGIDYDDLPATGKSHKATALVAFVHRHGRIAELVRVGKASRPELAWEAENE